MPGESCESKQVFSMMKKERPRGRGGRRRKPTH